MKTLLIAASALALGTAAYAGPGMTGMDSKSAGEMAQMDPAAKASQIADARDEKLRDDATAEAYVTPDQSAQNDATAETQVYDGPDSYTPSQPPPQGYTGMGGPEYDDVMAQPMTGFRPIIRNAYPVCSIEITDNCTQRIDPGN